MQVPQKIGTVLNSQSVSGMRWHDEVRDCPLHGQYLGRVILVGGEKVCDGPCPECLKIRQIKDAQKREEELRRAKAEAETRRLQDAIGRACIPDDFKDKTFDSFIASTENQQRNLSLCRRYSDNWKKVRENGYSLLMFGNPGTGKSHLACSIIRSLLPGITALYVRVPDVISFVRSQWRADAEESEHAAKRRFIDLDLLVLDEIGIQSGTSNEQSILFQIIDGRLSENRPTIFLTNLMPKALAEVLGDRIMDRINGKSYAMQFLGESHRKAPLMSDVFGEAA